MTRTHDRVRALRRRALLAVALVAVAALVAPRPAAARKHPHRPVSSTFQWAGVPAGERVVEVYGVNGDIRATHSENDTLYVEAVKRGQKSDPEEVEVSVEPDENGVRVCARYPRPSGDLNACGPDQDVRDCDVIVDFTLRVPAGARLVAHTVNGSIGGEDMQGPVEAGTVNGGVSVVSTHRVNATTVNGSIDVMLGPLGWTGPMSFTTTNGSVLLRLPPSPNAALDARTAEGRIECGLALADTRRKDARELVGTLGKGGPAITLATVNGNIEIRGE